MDLLAVLLMGMVVAGTSSLALGTPSAGHLNFVSDHVPSTLNSLIAFAAFAGALLILKSLASFYLTRRTYRFIAYRAAIISSDISTHVLSLPLAVIQRRSSQQLVQALTSGVSAASVMTLGPVSIIISELSLTVLLLAGLTAVDPLVAVFTTVFFGLVGVLLQLALGRWAHQLGFRGAQAEIGSIEALQHAVRAYRELVVSNRRGTFISRFRDLRWRAASVAADTFILSQAGKYVFEIALVLGAGALILILATSRSLEAAILALTVFLLVATRVFPSILRMQGAFTQLRNAEGVSTELFALVDELQIQLPSLREEDSRLPADREFIAKVTLTDVSVRYPSSPNFALEGISLEIDQGQTVAIVGPTGAGKSTLADVILGIIRPASGTVQLSGLDPERAVVTWPGAIAYVPQDVAVLSGTVRENVALGYPDDQIDDDWVWEALEKAQLSTFLLELREGLDTVVGEHGVKLSGGQRQRLGIARALYTRPKLLVLDEATSALDAQTEQHISTTLEAVGSEVTRIVVAHRLATVRESSLVLFIDGGRLIAKGSFEEVRQRVPAFERQAHLLGL